jgi:hypothetical protein
VLHLDNAVKLSIYLGLGCAGDGISLNTVNSCWVAQHTTGANMEVQHRSRIFIDMAWPAGDLLVDEA